MKWMGWSWADLATTPADVVDTAVEMMAEEAEHLESLKKD